MGLTINRYNAVISQKSFSSINNKDIHFGFRGNPRKYEPRPEKPGPKKRKNTRLAFGIGALVLAIFSGTIATAVHQRSSSFIQTQRPITAGLDRILGGKKQPAEIALQLADIIYQDNSNSFIYADFLRKASQKDINSAFFKSKPAKSLIKFVDNLELCSNQLPQGRKQVSLNQQEAYIKFLKSL